MFSRTYGIEIEAIAPAGISRDMIAARISEAGVPCYNANYTHRTTPEWKVVSDASLRTSGGGTTGMEFVSPPLSGEEGLEQVAKVSAVLLANGFTVNRSCGLHVHVAARNLPIAAMRKLMALYSKYEPVLDSFMPPSRRGNANTYCQSVARGTDMSVIAQAQSATEIARATQRGSR